MSERKTAIGVDLEKVMREEEYPTCYKCGSPVVYFVHAEGPFSITTCTNNDCNEGFESFAKSQIHGSVVKNCIEEDGVETVLEDVDHCVDKIENVIKPIMKETEPLSDERKERLIEEGDYEMLEDFKTKT